MNDDQRAFLRLWEETLARAGELRVEASSLLAKHDTLAEDVRLSDATLAYRKIERAADGILAKRDMSREEAVALALKRRPELYGDYSQALEKALNDPVGHVGNLQNARDLLTWAESRLAQASDPDALRNELRSDPQIQAAFAAVQADTERRAREAKAHAAKVQKAATSPSPSPAPALRREPPFGVPRREMIAKNAQPVCLSDRDSDRELLDILDTAAPGEGVLVDSARADGADETVAKAVAGVARLVNGIRDSLSRETLSELRKAVSGE